MITYRRDLVTVDDEDVTDDTARRSLAAVSRALIARPCSDTARGTASLLSLRARCRSVTHAICRGADYRVADYRVADYRVADYRVADYRVADYRVTDYRVTDYRVADYRVTDYRVAASGTSRRSSLSPPSGNADNRSTA